MHLTLWDRDRPEYNEDELGDINKSISDDAQNFLERAHLATATEYKPENLKGYLQDLCVTDEKDMIPAILQLSEAIVVRQDKYDQVEQNQEIRHKIVDRLASLYLLE